MPSRDGQVCLEVWSVRGEEVGAQRVVALELGVPVLVDDDGTAPSMYDLRVGLRGARTGQSK